MGYGLVVVTTGNGGLAEVVGANGFAKAIEPTAEAIALAVADFENRNLTALRLQAKHRYLQNFSPSAVSASWESAYKEIIANHPSSNIA
jgi:glycosyltransferase involved in cell wall biosynthesis